MIKKVLKLVAKKLIIKFSKSLLNIIAYLFNKPIKKKFKKEALEFVKENGVYLLKK